MKPFELANLAFDAFVAKGPRIQKAWNYYDGDHPVVFSAQAIADLVPKFNLTHFVQNWCKLIIEAPLSRLRLSRFVIADDTKAETALNAFWKTSEMFLDADTVHESTLVTGEGYVFVWADEQPDGSIEVRATWTLPQSAQVWYAGEDPSLIELGARMWTETDGTGAIQILTPEDVTVFRTTKEMAEITEFNFTDWIIDIDSSGPHPFGIVPLFHFRLNRRTITGKMKQIYSVQDGINIEMSNMMLAGDFAATPQRYAVTDAGLSKVRWKPGGILDFPMSDGASENTQIGEFSAANMSGFLDVIRQLVESMLTMTGTPRHFFEGSGTVSGEALVALEAPLNRQVEDKQAAWGLTWGKFGAFVGGLLTDREIAVEDVSVVWEEAKTVQPLHAAMTRKANVEAGIPLETLLRKEGWSEAQLGQLEDDQVSAGEADLATRVTPDQVTVANAQALVDALTAAVLAEASATEG